MATIDSKSIIDAIIAGNGYYPGDENNPPVTKIIEYDNQWGGRSTAVVYQNENQMRYEESPCCSNIKVIWTRQSIG